MQGAVISRTIDELICFSRGFFKFSLVLWKIRFLSTLKNTPIALMQAMFGFCTKSSRETEQKRLVSKGGDDFPAIRDLKILWTRPRRASTGSEIFNSWI